MLGPPVAARTSSGNVRHSSTEPRPSWRKTSGGAPVGGPESNGRRSSVVDRCSADLRAMGTGVRPSGRVELGPAARTAGSCPVAVFGRLSTGTTWRGRLKAAIRSRQWASMVVGVDVMAGLRHDEGHDHLQPALVAGADHRGLQHVGVLDQHALHLGRRDPDAARLDHVAVAAEEAVVAGRRPGVDVAGAQPVAPERGLGGLGPAPVARWRRTGPARGGSRAASTPSTGWSDSSSSFTS